MQLSFGDAEYNGKHKQTWREIFLCEMDKVVPWKELLKLIEPHYPKLGQPGRQHSGQQCSGCHRLCLLGNQSPPGPGRQRTRHYDAAGNTIDIGGTRSFDYDASGRVIRVKRNNAVAMNYVYNGRGEQVRRHHDQTDTVFIYDEAGRLLGEYGSDGQPTRQYLWMDDLPVGLLAEGKLHYVQPDHLGTPRVVIDPQRDVAVWKWDLRGEAFGHSEPNEDPDGDGKLFTLDLRFPGQRYDAATGLNYNYFRDYDSISGRYIQSDPIGLEGGINTYGYVHGNPLLKTDRYGLDSFTCIASDPYVGSYVDGRKQCGYSCKSNNGCSVKFTGPGYSSGFDSQLCYGAIVEHGVSPSGQQYQMARGHEKFEIETSAWTPSGFIDAMFKYGFVNSLENAIKESASEECMKCQ